ncbi:MAG: TerB family tellurite resistance protein [Rikenellaceae bacterium]|nr:TerB family tellurite resistance protein [Rikenellaceae bacterium]MBR2014291.1 TerB family tellurite resistance protein [Alistipes sp.]
MNTDIKNLAAVLATVVWADGVYDEAEKVAVEEIAEALELDNAELTAAVEAALGEVENMNEEQVNEYILNNSAEIDEEEAEIVFEAALQIAIVDGVLGTEEVDNLLAVASALGIDDARAVLLIIDLAKEEEELELAF